MYIKRRIILNDIKYTLYKWKYNSKIIKAEQEKNQIKKVLSLYIIYHKKIYDKETLYRAFDEWRCRASRHCFKSIYQFYKNKEKFNNIYQTNLSLNNLFDTPERKLRKNSLKNIILKIDEKMKLINNLIKYKYLKIWEKFVILTNNAIINEEINKKSALLNAFKINLRHQYFILLKAFKKWIINIIKSKQEKKSENENSKNICVYKNNYIKKANHNFRNFAFAQDIYPYYTPINNMRIEEKGHINTNRSIYYGYRKINEKRSKNSKNINKEEQNQNNSELFVKNTKDFDNNIILKENKSIEFETCKIKDSKLFEYQLSKDISVKDQSIIRVFFVSMGIQDIKYYSLYCKKNDLFINLEINLYSTFPKYKEYDNVFLINAHKINRFKTIKENNIKDDDIINIYIFE